MQQPPEQFEWVEFATEQPFHRGWIRYWGSEDEPEPDLSSLVIEAGFDPAISKNDRAARCAPVSAMRANDTHAGSRAAIARRPMLSRCAYVVGLEAMNSPSTSSCAIAAKLTWS